jgi:outer membrane protein OmpA-like peptidoglycan-associated protein
MRTAPLFAAITAALLLAPSAHAQLSGPTGSLERFSPAQPGDPMFGVASPSIGGHLVPRFAVAFDYAHHPLSIQDGSKRLSIVSRQGFLHVGASLALFDRLQVSADMPFALLQGGDSPTVAGTTFTSPGSPQVGDFRLGARVRIVGGDWDAFQLGVGANAFFPSAPKGSYAGDGAIRGEPQLLLGGRFTHFVWSLAAGSTLRASAHPHTFNAGAGAAFVLGEDFFQIGPELTLSVPFSKDSSLSTTTTDLSIATRTAAELLIGAKIRPVGPLVFGAGAGPGLTNGWGTPVFFAVGTIGYDPRPPHFADDDGDGIADGEDACPDVRGLKRRDPKKNGGPADRDNDGIPDTEDACPDQKGEKSAAAEKNGCPATSDRDGDGIPDGEDACPDQKGDKSDTAGKNGCPATNDRDGDGIPDGEDACPDQKGDKSDTAGKNGCPAASDRDGDGIPDSEDACPDQKGGADTDKKQNGCPHVQVTPTEILTNRQIHFVFARAEITQTIDPVSDSLLDEVRRAILDHPEIEAIEVQGHADALGPEDYNMLLSRRRAEAVRDWLVQHGIQADKLTAKGYGSRNPVATNSTTPGRQENRRVSFSILKKTR